MSQLALAGPDLPKPPLFDGLVTVGTPEDWAVFDRVPQPTYRYLLARMWDELRPVMVWCMLNPSVAGAAADDPTIRKCLGFARRRHCGGIIVCNLGAYIATDPREFARAADPVGPRNPDMISWAYGAPMMAVRVGGWGGFPSRRLRERLKASWSGALCAARTMWCFGKTKDGEPRHPLMLSYDTPLVSFADGRPFP